MKASFKGGKRLHGRQLVLKKYVTFYKQEQRQASRHGERLDWWGS